MECLFLIVSQIVCAEIQNFCPDCRHAVLSQAAHVNQAQPLTSLRCIFVGGRSNFRQSTQKVNFCPTTVPLRSSSRPTHFSLPPTISFLLSIHTMLIQNSLRLTRTAIAVHSPSQFNCSIAYLAISEMHYHLLQGQQHSDTLLLKLLYTPQFNCAPRK
jgi:hypothetical protein